MIQRIWHQLTSTADTWEEADQTAEEFLFSVVLLGLGPEDQLFALLLRPGRAHDLVRYEQHFLPVTDWQMVRNAFANATNTKALSRFLWFISMNPASVPHELLSTCVMPLLAHEDSLIRSLVLKIVYGVGDAKSSETVIRSTWTHSSTYCELENHWGSLVLCEHSNGMPFDELCRRVHPAYLGHAVSCRNGQENEVRIYAESIHRIWLRLDTIKQALPIDLPDFTVDSTVSGTVVHFSRVGIADNTLADSVTFQSLHSTWGGRGSGGFDLEKWKEKWNAESFAERQKALLQILRAAIEQQKAAGNIWFGQWLPPESLKEVIEQHPDLVAEWVRAVLEDGSDGMRYLNQTGSFYTALCLALLGRSQDSGVALYWRLQEAGTRVHVIDRDTEIEEVDFALFNASPTDTIQSAWERKLRQCSTDQELLKVTVLSQYGAAKNWLWSWAAERTNSSVPIEKARAIALLGFLDDQEAREALQQLSQSQPDTWLGKLVKTSIERWDRNMWAKHWFRRFLTHDQDVEAWASFRLFLKSVDSRLWLWQRGMEDHLGNNRMDMQRRMFLNGNMENVRNSIKKNERKMAERFLGQKIMKNQIWPWMSFS